MGQLIDITERLAERRIDRSRVRDREHVAFFFDLASPYSYLAAERVERLLGDVEWIPAAALGTLGRDACAEAEREALALRLPLVWPERVPLSFQHALRVAAYAADEGRAGQFALAAMRLAFCGGFDLDDPEILAEAAGAAGLWPEDCLSAAHDDRWDAQLGATAAGLERRGATALPAISIGAHLLEGRHAITQAVAIVHATAIG